MSRLLKGVVELIAGEFDKEVMVVFARPTRSGCPDHLRGVIP
jgi:hypothetical protein